MKDTPKSAEATVGTKLPSKSDSTGSPSKRPRAAGTVQLGRDARLELAFIPLGSINAISPPIRARNARLDLATATPVDIDDLLPETLDLLLCTPPPWVLPRGGQKDLHYVLIAGGHLLPALRLRLPPKALVPALLVHSKFSDSRLLQLAAAHAAAVAVAASALSSGALLEILKDAAAAGAPVTRSDPSRLLAVLDHNTHSNRF
jgi:hypothetical protein